MREDLFTVEEVADRLGLHVRTIRNYIREGRLKAVKIGKQYRIAAADLEALTGRPVGAAERPVRRHRHVDVSSIVEIDAISREDANRVSTLLMGIANGGREPWLRVDTSYLEERGQLKVVVLSDLATTADVLGMIHTITDEARK
jgi:excisionase family DNA binding protein